MLSPLLKYPGGKTKELKFIMPSLPGTIKNYYEPFIGGGAVYWAMKDIDGQYFINDKSDELIRLYKAVKIQDQSFFAMIERMDESWLSVGEYVNQHMDELVNLFRVGIVEETNEAKLDVSTFVDDNANQLRSLITVSDNNVEFFIKDLKSSMNRKITFLRKEQVKGTVISRDDFESIIETAVKSSLYLYNRMLINSLDEFDFTDGEKAALYLNMRDYSYSSMFRYNKSGKFNVPYGGMSYNTKLLGGKAKNYTAEDLVDRLSNTVIGNNDFYDFMRTNTPDYDDFIFLDPPYDSEFSTYANNAFDKSDQERLAKYLISETKANWMMIIKNTELISSLYPAGQETANGCQVFLNAFDKSYQVSFMNRNDKNVEHLIITNYEV